MWCVQNRGYKTASENLWSQCFSFSLCDYSRPEKDREQAYKKKKKKSGLHIHFVPVMMDNYLTSFEIAVDVSRLFCPGFC